MARSRGVKYKSSKVARSTPAVHARMTILISLVLIFGTLVPSTARASVFDTFLSLLPMRLISAPAQVNAVSAPDNVQTMPLPRPAMNIDPAPGRGGADISIVDDSALVPSEGPAGVGIDITKPKNSTISVYVVREGDTLSGIAQLFSVSPSTILWANDLPKGSTLQIGQTLTILPVTGVKYTTKKGDTVASIAKHFGGDASEIASFNGLESGALAVDIDIIIPDGEVPTIATPAKKSGVAVRATTGSASQIGFYLRPIVGGLHTQGIHGYNAVDLAAPIGTPILASAEGDVIVAKQGGWNGGYGSYIVIQHSNGSQTLYSHASRVIVSVGQHLVQGQVIGYVGQTGKATGPHVHFEIRNGIRNPF